MKLKLCNFNGPYLWYLRVLELKQNTMTPQTGFRGLNEDNSQTHCHKSWELEGFNSLYDHKINQIQQFWIKTKRTHKETWYPGIKFQNWSNTDYW